MLILAGFLVERISNDSNPHEYDTIDQRQQHVWVRASFRGATRHSHTLPPSPSTSRWATLLDHARSATLPARQPVSLISHFSCTTLGCWQPHNLPGRAHQMAARYRGLPLALRLRRCRLAEHRVNLTPNEGGEVKLRLLVCPNPFSNLVAGEVIGNDELG